MKVATFSTKPHDREFLQPEGQQFEHEFIFFENQLREETVSLAEGCEAVCAFVNDDLSSGCLEKLHALGIGVIVMRCAGFNNIDLSAAKKLDITILRVPEYSPYAVAEYALAMLLTLKDPAHHRGSFPFRAAFAGTDSQG